MKILTGNSNRPLAEAISAYLNLPLTKASVRRFSDMEIFVEIHENVRGEDVFVVELRRPAWREAPPVPVSASGDGTTSAASAPRTPGSTGSDPGPSP